MSERDFGAYLYRLRMAKGLGVPEVANYLRVSVQQVYDWEAGVKMPAPSHLLDLSRLYHISVHDLLVAR
ncbi:MAG TPA: helix-turn-helix transcriptional regulator [Candidatus Nitrosotenuis sp.]|nr:helix-turn-helix transcriptional regulator [Candidatus Nitrosotenuis sp.]